MQQFGASAFYTAARSHKLGEVDTGCTSHNSIVLAIRMPKIIKLVETGTFFGLPCSV